MHSQKEERRWGGLRQGHRRHPMSSGHKGTQNYIHRDAVRTQYETHAHLTGHPERMFFLCYIIPFNKLAIFNLLGKIPSSGTDTGTLPERRQQSAIKA